MQAYDRVCLCVFQNSYSRDIVTGLRSIDNINYNNNNSSPVRIFLLIP